MAETPDVEQPTGDIEEQQADEPEPEQPPFGGPTPEAVERGFRAVKQSWGTYKSSVARNLDFMAEQLLECPMCNPQVPGHVNVNDAGHYPPEIIGPIKAFLGFSQEVDYEQDTDTRTCPKCGGLGEVKTGSQIPENSHHRCNNCMGYGFVPPPGGDQPPITRTGEVLAPSGESAAPLDQNEIDPTGEPKILPDGRPNPNFGKWPQFKILVPPYGITANLTAQDG
jgi:hypothetical protein